MNTNTNLAGQAITIRHKTAQTLIFGYVVPESWILEIDGRFMAAYKTREAAEEAAASDYVQMGRFV